MTKNNQDNSLNKYEALTESITLLCFLYRPNNLNSSGLGPYKLAVANKEFLNSSISTSVF